ncbi:uncharacterized protein LOC141658639 [Silene latifolia]|uniref:uncharacterized protein LOC141658639 n=1 Tax=Silene latifolia TaxID=37657 RepID=UPI003D776E7C
MPRFKKAKLNTYKPVKSTKVPGASSSGSKFFCLFCHSVSCIGFMLILLILDTRRAATRASARIASFGLSLVKAGVSQITGEKSKSNEATGSDSAVQIQEPVQGTQLVSPEKIVDESDRPEKRKRVEEFLGGVHEVRGVRARMDEVQFAKDQIQAQAFVVDDPYFKYQAEEASARALAAMYRSRDYAANLVTMLQENVNDVLRSACQLESVHGLKNALDWEVQILKKDADKFKAELEVSKAENHSLKEDNEAGKARLLVESSKLKSAQDALKALQAKFDIAQEELKAEKQAMQEQLKVNEELAVERDEVQARYKDAALYFFGKGRVDAMKEPAEVRPFWDPDQELADLNTTYPELCKLHADEEVDSPPSKGKNSDAEGDGDEEEEAADEGIGSATVSKVG